MLLQFTVENFRSFLSESSVSMMGRHKGSSSSAESDWLGRTTRTTGIYGANGSGKTNLLLAIWHAANFIRLSATRWADRPTTGRQPFRLGQAGRDLPTSFEFDFILGNVRHVYGFALTDSAVSNEYLLDFANGRSRLLFERNDSEYKFGRGLRGENAFISRSTKVGTLFLSAAANLRHPQLALVYDYFQRIQFAEFDDNDRVSRLTWARKALEEPGMLLKAQALLQYSDIGIKRIVLHEVQETDSEFQSFKAFYEQLSQMLAGEPSKKSKKKSTAQMEPDEPNYETFRKRLRFVHEGGSEADAFEQGDESSGTMAWLSLAIPALKAIEQGGLLMIDELDASLHPRLASAILSLFKSEIVNKTGAQLLFTSHDATLMGQFEHSKLEADEVWFCEKQSNGISSLFSLLEFAPREKDNFERRYLLGRYGAVPMLTEEELAAHLANIDDKVQLLERS